MTLTVSAHVRDALRDGRARRGPRVDDLHPRPAAPAQRRGRAEGRGRPARRRRRAGHHRRPRGRADGRAVGRPDPRRWATRTTSSRSACATCRSPRPCGVRAARPWPGRRSWRRGPGIAVFATGGLGGVHRGASETFDESADLPVLAQTRILMVSAGVKSILDVGASLERLETLSITLVGYRTTRFPGFYLADSGFAIDYAVDGPEQAADLVRARDALGVPGAILVANPVPAETSSTRPSTTGCWARRWAAAGRRGHRRPRRDAVPARLHPARHRGPEPGRQRGGVREQRGRRRRDRAGAGRAGLDRFSTAGGVSCGPDGPGLWTRSADPVDGSGDGERRRKFFGTTPCAGSSGPRRTLPTNSPLAGGWGSGRSEDPHRDSPFGEVHGGGPVTGTTGSEQRAGSTEASPHEVKAEGPCDAHTIAGPLTLSRPSCRIRARRSPLESVNTSRHAGAAGRVVRPPGGALGPGPRHAPVRRPAPRRVLPGPGAGRPDGAARRSRRPRGGPRVPRRLDPVRPRRGASRRGSSSCRRRTTARTSTTSPGAGG